MISITVAPSHSTSTSPMAPDTTHTSSSVSSPTAMTVFAAVFLLLIFILVVLSFLALARQYRRRSVPVGNQTLSASTADWDLEAQGDRDDSFTEKTPRPRELSALYVRAFFGSSWRSLVGTSGDALPLPVSASSSSGDSTLARRLTGGLRSSFKKACLVFKGFSCIVVYGVNGFPALAQKSWNAISPYDADLAAERLVPRPFFIGEAPRIIVTLPSDEDIALEVSSPASTYSEPDSPTVETPILGSAVDTRVYEGTSEGDWADQAKGHPEVYANDALVEPKNFLITAYGFGFETYAEQREKGDRLIGAFAALLSSESLSDYIEDGGDDGSGEEHDEPRLEDTTAYLAEVEPVLKHAEPCAAIVHWWPGSSSPSAPYLMLGPEPSPKGVPDDSGHFEADASFYSCSSASIVGDVDDRAFGRGDFALSPATSGEVYYDCYG
ncbi:hypothetical protein C8Q79DRAFT_782011 [Trametes meyenii]|nr:hypothetical protein C8Q79DRAFT_782011 [Trametes meyenii]